MAIVSLFSHKGGVSRTTTTFNLGWALAVPGETRVGVVAETMRRNRENVRAIFDGLATSLSTLIGL